MEDDSGNMGPLKQSNVQCEFPEVSQFIMNNHQHTNRPTAE